MQPTKPGFRWRRVFFYLFCITAISVTFWQRQNVVDQWHLRDYQPSVVATQLATNSTMTDNGRKIFYLQNPQIQDKAAFYASCEDGETAVVLGCYKPSNGIFVLQVTDSRLAGVEEVTAAHEMLHAAYGRLNYFEKRHVDRLVQEAYDQVTDQDIKDKINLYKKDGADINNELHSILATEVASLPVELNQYYSRYFQNRSKIVNYAMAYKSEFKTRKAKLESLDNQLTSLENQIIANNKTLDQQQLALETESQRLDSLLKQGQIDQYNSGVIAYNKSLTPFRSLLAKTKQLVGNYKSTLAARNQLAEEAQELNKALDSRITTTVKEI